MAWRCEMQLFTVLCVEDNVDHAVLIKAAIRSGVHNCSVQVAENGAAARAYLEAPNAESSPRPALIITDMWLGDSTGLDLLRWLAQRPDLQDIPVIMFSSTTDSEVVEQAYALGVRRFVLKAMDFRDVVKVIHEVVNRVPFQKDP